MNNAYSQLTPAQRKKYLSLMFPNKLEIHFVVDKEHMEENPSVEITENGFDIICSEYQKFNMSRKDDSPFWDHFYSFLNVPKSLPLPEKGWPDENWLVDHFNEQQNKNV